MNAFVRTFLVLVMVAVSASLCACVSKGQAKAQAEAAFRAGEQQAMTRIQQTQMQGQVVRINGPVRQPILPWVPNMTVASALVAADYQGGQPTGIIVVRAGRAMPVNPADLLAGRDVQLLAGDIVQVETAGEPAPQPVR